MMGLSDCAMKSEVLRNLRHVKCVNDVLEMCEVYKSVTATAIQVGISAWQTTKSK